MVELKSKECLSCKKLFFNRRKNGHSLGDSQFNKSIFCSLKCFRNSGRFSRAGTKYSEEQRRATSERLKKEYAEGKHKIDFTPELRKKMSDARKKAIREGRVIFWNKGKGTFDEKKYKREYMQRRLNTDPLFRLHTRIRTRMYHYFKGSKPRRTFDLLGADIEIVKRHIEAQFQEGMSWENYGEWHVDHIIPLASAKTFEAALKLWNYTNLQPLWAHDNFVKSDTIPNNVKVAFDKQTNE